MELVETLWNAYLDVAHPGDAVTFERDTVGMLGCLLAARVDGKSPAEYLTTDELRERVRSLSVTILLDQLTTLREVRQATV